MTAPPSIDALLGDIVTMAHNAAEGRASPQSLLRYINKRIDEYRAATLAPAAPVEGMVERYKAALDQISDVCNQPLPGIDLALNIRGIIATLDKPQGVGDNGG